MDRRRDTSPGRRPRGKREPAREPGGSAGSALRGILGEYVVPQTVGGWQETLIQAMSTVGFSPATTRQAISRAVREGALVTTRHRNRAYVELRDEARETLVRGSSHLESLIADDSDGGGGGPGDSEWNVFVVRFRDKDTSQRYHVDRRNPGDPLPASPQRSADAACPLTTVAGPGTDPKFSDLSDFSGGTSCLTRHSSAEASSSLASPTRTRRP
jgi:hypothetical protein